MDVSSCSIAGKCSIGQWNDYTAVFVNEITEFVFDVPSFTSYVYMDYIEVKPSTNGYTNFQIDKTLHADMIFTPTASSVYSTTQITDTNIITATNFTF